MEEQIVFKTDDGEEVLFYVLEETRVSGVNYLLVADSQEEEATALILRDTSGPEDTEAVYEIVEDEETLAAVSELFKTLLEDTDIQ